MRLFYSLFIGMICQELLEGKIVQDCRFARTFYQQHSNIFQLDRNDTSLTIRPLYALSNQSFSIGLIYRLADTHLVPVPLLLECLQNKQIFAPIDCELTIIDTRTDFSVRRTESTRTTTVPLHFQGYSAMKIRGAYFKPSTIALRNCRLDTKENLLISKVFYLQIEFEQTINSPCQDTCLHPQLYHCSSVSNTCQCHSTQLKFEEHNHLCVDTELISNCSLTPERCRHLCRPSDPIDHHCQCPLGTRRILSNHIYQCDLAILSECNNDLSSIACPNGSVCREKRCVKIITLLRMNTTLFSLPLVLIIALIGALLIIIILVIILLKMRSIRCIKFVHPHVLSSHSSSSLHQTREKYTKIDFFE